MIYFGVIIFFSGFLLGSVKKSGQRPEIICNMLSFGDVYLNEGLLMEREGGMTDKRVQAGVAPAGWTNYSKKGRL